MLNRNIQAYKHKKHKLLHKHYNIYFLYFFPKLGLQHGTRRESHVNYAHAESGIYVHCYHGDISSKKVFYTEIPVINSACLQNRAGVKLGGSVDLLEG